MEKKLSDYLHLYLGCEVMAGTHRCKLVGIQENGAIVISSIGAQRCIIIFPNIKPILRPLSDMTEEEKVIGQDMVQVEGCSDIIVCNSAESFRYLLSKGFDLFGLTEAGLAIDKTKLPAHA